MKEALGRLLLYPPKALLSNKSCEQNVDYLSDFLLISVHLAQASFSVILPLLTAALSRSKACNQCEFTHFELFEMNILNLLSRNPPLLISLAMAGGWIVGAVSNRQNSIFHLLILEMKFFGVRR